MAWSRPGGASRALPRGATLAVGSQAHAVLRLLGSPCSWLLGPLASRSLLSLFCVPLRAWSLARCLIVQLSPVLTHGRLPPPRCMAGVHTALPLGDGTAALSGSFQLGLELLGSGAAGELQVLPCRARIVSRLHSYNSESLSRKEAWLGTACGSSPVAANAARAHLPACRPSCPSRVLLSLSRVRRALSAALGQRRPPGSTPVAL